MNVSRIGFGILIAASLTGCAEMVLGPRQQWVAQPPAATVENDIYIATLTPGCTDFGCRAFTLVLTNKTDKNLEVDWNKTLYIAGGQTSGGFMFEGVVYKDRNNPKPPDVVFGKGSLGKIIWPNNLVSFSSGRYGGWEHAAMSAGEHGAYLTLIVDGKERHEKLTVMLSVAPKQ